MLPNYQRFGLGFAILLSTFGSVSAQNRSLGANTFVIDDGSGHTVTLQSTPGATGTFTFPNGGGTLATQTFLSANYLPLAGGTLSTSSLATLLTLTSTTAAPATALSMNGGRVVMQSTASTPASGGTIATNVAAVVVGDNGVTNSPATITLPAGTEGQVLYITTQDPDGVTITTTVNSVVVSVTIDDSEVGTFMYLGGQWRLQH